MAARVGAALPAAVVAAVLAGGAGDGGRARWSRWAARPGSSRSRGIRAPWEVAVGGAVATAVAFLALVAVAAALAGPRSGACGAARSARGGAAWTGLGPEALVGLRLAVRGHGRAVGAVGGGRRGRGGHRRGARVRVGHRAAAVGSRAVPGRPPTSRSRTPRRPTSPSSSSTRGWRRWPSRARSRPTLADGGVLPVQASTPRKGVVPAGLATGRLPDGPAEIALSPRIAARRGLNVGDVVTVVNRNGRPMRLTVTGTVVAVDDGGHLGTSNVVTDAALGGLARTAPHRAGRDRRRAGDRRARSAAELGRSLEILPRQTPPEVRNLADLAQLPEILAGGARPRRGGGDGAHPHHRGAPPHAGDGRARRRSARRPRRSGARWRCSAARSSRPRWCSGCPSASPPPGCCGGRWRRRSGWAVTSRPRSRC